MVSKAAEKSSKVSVVNDLVGMLTVAYWTSDLSQYDIWGDLLRPFQVF